MRTLPLALGIILTLANAWKPLVIDDAAYHRFASHIADHPGDPYGFRMIWYQYSMSAFDILAPAALPYWWAGAIALFGDDPVAWKLALFPFAWLLAWSLDVFVRRFAPGYRVPVLGMLVLSPVIVPGFNLMLDVPAYALMFGGLAVFSSGRSSWHLVSSGLLLGLAMQTKYTALLGPPAVVLLGWTQRRWLSPIVVSFLALGVFAAWEGYLVSVYGESHFWSHLTAEASGDTWEKLWKKAQKAGPLFGYVGCLGPAIGLLAWAAVGLRSRWLWAMLLSFLIFLGSLTLLPWAYTGFAAGPMSLLIATGTAGVIYLLARHNTPAGWFLILWFALEVLGYFALTPFGAARRVIGVMTVATLMSAHLAEVRGVKRMWVNIAGGFGILLGVTYGAVDWLDAYPEKRAAEATAQWIRERNPEGDPVWFTGIWGFQFYAMREGMRPIWPDESVVAAESWVVLPDAKESNRPRAQSVIIDPEYLEPVASFSWSIDMPIRTNPTYYGGHTPASRHRGPRVIVTVYRVKREWRPESRSE